MKMALKSLLKGQVQLRGLGSWPLLLVSLLDVQTTTGRLEIHVTWPAMATTGYIFTLVT